MVVTVIDVQGSAPREVGATMIVSASGISGTIGGGNLEHTCIREAGELLSSNDDLPIGLRAGLSAGLSAGEARSCHVRCCKRLSLGPSLGQCCGGAVELLFELVTAETDWYQLMTSGHGFLADHPPLADHWLCRSLKSSTAMLVNADELRRCFTFTSNTGVDKIVSAGIFSRMDDANRWFCQKLSTQKPAVMVYGAGHVGQAVVTQLALLPCHITLLDHREDWLALQGDLEITRQLTDSPEDDAIIASADAAHVVMTHSHAMDFEICLALLQRAEFGLSLIHI